MKKTFYLFVGLVTTLLAFSSCKKSTDSDATLQFSSLTVEQQKQSIEDNGLNLMNKVEAMKNTPAMIALNAISTKINGSPLFVKPLAQLRTNLLMNDTKAVEAFSQQMKVAAVAADGQWGTYTWNSTTKDFDFVKGSNYSAKILFPATQSSTTNSGEVTIAYAESTAAVPETNPVQYMPKTLSIVLKVSGTTALTFYFDATYKSDATPTKITQTLVIDKYNWNVTFTNNDVDVSSKYSFKYDQDILLKFEVGASGSLTATNIQNNIEDNPEKVLSSGAVSFQVMNIAMKGTIANFKGFVTEVKAHKPDSIIHSNAYGKWTEYFYTKAYYDKSKDIINKYFKIFGYFANENKKFADIEFYTNEYSYTGSKYNSTNGMYEYGLVTEYNVQPRFVLSDGSKVAIEDYVKVGFEDLITKMQSYQ
jgi:hypothetical protein